VPPTENIIFLKKYVYILKYHKFALSGQMSLKIMAELLKNAHVLLKRYLQWWQLLPIDSGFKSYVNRVLRLLTYTSFITLCNSKVRISE